jgi:3-dehydroquinate dehydratase-2
LQGPNFNLIGVRSAQIGEHITLNKINSALRKEARELKAELKILQTAKVDRALTFLHRNRNWAEGIILAPMAWAHYEYSIQEALALLAIPSIQIILKPPFALSETSESIFDAVCLKTITKEPVSAYLSALQSLLNQ